MADSNSRSATMQMSPSTKAVGFAAAVLTTAFSLIYVAGQLAEWMGWLGSAGGPESSSTPLGLAVLLTPSLLLGPAFLLLAVSVHQLARQEHRVWSHAGVSFATAYAVLTGLVYYVQVTLVGPRMARGELNGIEPFVFLPFDSFLYAVDILGYSFMSMATLCMAGVFRGDGLERTARRLLIANGLLLPFLSLQMYWHSLIWGGAFWAITFPSATWTLAMIFRRGGGDNAAAAACAAPVEQGRKSSGTRPVPYATPQHIQE